MESPYITPKVAAVLMAVHPATVVRYANEGRLKSYATLGGHRRFLRADVEKLAPRAFVPEILVRKGAKLVRKPVASL